MAGFCIFDRYSDEHDISMRGAVRISCARRVYGVAHRHISAVEHHWMLLLTLALQLKVVKLRHVEKTADFLVHNLGFFFVPAGVGLMSCLGLIAREWMPIAGATVVSTTVILVVTGHVHQFMRRSIRQRHRHDNAGANQPTKIAD